MRVRKDINRDPIFAVPIFRISLDKAVVDLINHGHHRHFKDAGVYEDMFSYASTKGLGNLEYNLIKA